jgi:hypothetical protein
LFPELAKMKDALNNGNPECFGDLSIVFPKADDGLRQSPASCMGCPVKTECLRRAMAGADGLRAREEMTRRAYESGRIGFVERWRRKKELSLKKKKKGGAT